MVYSSCEWQTHRDSPAVVTCQLHTRYQCSSEHLQSRTPFSLVRRDEQRSVLRAVRVPSRLVLACACCWESSKNRHGVGSRRMLADHHPGVLRVDPMLAIGP